jgi:hypothetical protein
VVGPDDFVGDLDLTADGGGGGFQRRRQLSRQRPSRPTSVPARRPPLLAGGRECRPLGKPRWQSRPPGRRSIGSAHRNLLTPHEWIFRDCCRAAKAAMVSVSWCASAGEVAASRASERAGARGIVRSKPRRGGQRSPATGSAAALVHAEIEPAAQRRCGCAADRVSRWKRRGHGLIFRDVGRADGSGPVSTPDIILPRRRRRLLRRSLRSRLGWCATSGC